MNDLFTGYNLIYCALAVILVLVFAFAAFLDRSAFQSVRIPAPPRSSPAPLLARTQIKSGDRETALKSPKSPLSSPPSG
jgi:hypothetical protein